MLSNCWLWTRQYFFGLANDIQSLIRFPKDQHRKAGSERFPRHSKHQQNRFEWKKNKNRRITTFSKRSYHRIIFLLKRLVSAVTILLLNQLYTTTYPLLLHLSHADFHPQSKPTSGASNPSQPTKQPYDAGPSSTSSGHPGPHSQPRTT